MAIGFDDPGDPREFWSILSMTLVPDLQMMYGIMTLDSSEFSIVWHFFRKNKRISSDEHSSISNVSPSFLQANAVCVTLLMKLTRKQRPYSTFLKGAVVSKRAFLDSQREMP